MSEKPRFGGVFFFWHMSRLNQFSICLALLVMASAPNMALVLVAPPNLLATHASQLMTSVLAFFALFAMQPRLAVWLLVLLIPAALLETLYVLRYERATDEHVLSILAETNIQEAISWLGMAGGVFLLVGLAGVLVVAHVMRRFQWSQFQSPMRWRLIFVLAGGMAIMAIQLPDVVDLDQDLSLKTFGPVLAAAHTVSVHSGNPIDENLLGSPMMSSLSEVFPWGVPLRIKRYLALHSGMKEARQALAEFRFGAAQSPARAGDEVYILVIGETGRPDRWQLNGYGRPTNPRLSKVKGVVSFTNAITGWAWTRMSVPTIISRKPPQMSAAFFPEHSVVGAFREAGFWTAWYSMHGALGFQESAVALYADAADDVRYINPAGYLSPGVHDEALLVQLDTALARPERKKFIVLHTMGSHFNYAHRYPAAFDVFVPSLKNRRDADLYDRAQREELNNSYDNSIRYTDHVLAEMISRLEAAGHSAALLYVADHGENIFDGECDKSGHGQNTIYDFRIAALWWNSTAYTFNYPEKSMQAIAQRDAPWSTSNVFHLLLDAAGITYPGAEPENSLLSPTYTPRPRWTQAGVSFDMAEFDPVCNKLTSTQTPR